MDATVAACVRNGAGIGAHPGFPDLAGFGRRAMDLTPHEVRTDVLYQMGALHACSGYYVLFAYMPTFLSHELKFSAPQGLTVTGIALIVMVSCIPLAARLSDRVGRRPVLLGSAIGLALLAYPWYWLMTRGSVVQAVIGAAVMAVLFSGHSSQFVSRFPAAHRRPPRREPPPGPRPDRATMAV